ncbi:MAG: uroporphyrinogen-III C-methyltransferase [Bacteroidota bacterium]
MSKQPRITLVGAGPGDAELITLKGIKALKTADVVLYDALINEELLEFAENAEKVYVGKRSGEHSYSQEAVNKLLVDYAINYGHVVRLKGGDPFVFGRGYEELEYAAINNIPTEIIPGISSSISVAGLQHIPVTHRGLSESFWVVTGTTSSGNISTDVYDAAKSRATVVILMGLNKLQEITDIFKNENKGQLPVAVIQNGSTPQEKVVIGTVDNIVELVKENSITAPAIIIIGDVVSLHPLFQSSRNLHDACIRK